MPHPMPLPKNGHPTKILIVAMITIDLIAVGVLIAASRIQEPVWWILSITLFLISFYMTYRLHLRNITADAKDFETLDAAH